MKTFVERDSEDLRNINLQHGNGRQYPYVGENHYPDLEFSDEVYLGVIDEEYRQLGLFDDVPQENHVEMEEQAIAIIDYPDVAMIPSAINGRDDEDELLIGNLYATTDCPDVTIPLSTFFRMPGGDIIGVYEQCVAVLQCPDEAMSVDSIIERDDEDSRIINDEYIGNGFDPNTMKITLNDIERYAKNDHEQVICIMEQVNAIDRKLPAMNTE